MKQNNQKSQVDKIPFTSKLAGLTISKRNKAFNNMTPEEQRREIAYDGLLLVITGQAQASHGAYWSSSLDRVADRTETSAELQKALCNKLPKCEVCQRGLFMLSQIRLGNSVDPDDRNKDDGNEEIVKGFSMEDFRDAEREYEHTMYRNAFKNNTNGKLANICCNVIANGNYKKSDRKNYVKKWGLTIPAQEYDI